MNSTPVYVLGHDEPELKRLELQAKLIGGITQRLIRDSGIRKGMRVLDVGCGLGDVSMLLADAVGETGCVVAIDREARAIEAARVRAEERGYRQIEFHVSTDETIPTAGGFDAACGRYVLIHQPDPVALLRRVIDVVRPGGIVAFHEIALHVESLACPVIGLHREISHRIGAAYHALLPGYDIAGRLLPCFTSAGLPPPRLTWEAVVGDHTTDLLRWLAMSYFSMLPHIHRLGFAPLEEREVEHLVTRLAEAATERRAQIVSRPQVCGWAVRPERV